MKTVYPRGYQPNDFAATHTFGHMIYRFNLMVPVNQRVLRKLSKEHNVSGPKGSTPHRLFQISQR